MAITRELAAKMQEAVDLQTTGRRYAYFLKENTPERAWEEVSSVG